MIIEVRPDSPLPPYEQIRQQIATMVDTGVLPTGTRLPSIRQLASDLGLANGTVARAYRELEAVGYLASRVGQGTTVAATPRLSVHQRRDRLADAAATFTRTARQLGVPAEEALEAARRHLYAT